MTDMEKPNPASLRDSFAGAIQFWEARRAVYNLVLGAVTVTWILATWPHFRPALTFGNLLRLAGLALIANFLYCAAYLVDVPLQCSGLSAFWRRGRSGLWWAGTLFAILLTNYWISDEIYPFVR